TDRATALLAGLLCACRPRMIDQSVSVMVDSVFPFVVTLAFATAAWRPSGNGVRPAVRDALTGALLGLAFLLRGQAMIVMLPAAWLLVAGRPARGAIAGLMIAVVAGVAVASPFLLRNLRLFGAPFHSDVGAYGLWPYVAPLTFSHGLQRPPAPLGWALHHPLPVLAHWLWSVKRFFGHTLAE